LSEKLAALDLGFGVDAVTLEASELGNLGVEQGVLAHDDLRAGTDPSRDQLGVAALVDRLSNRLGQGCVFARRPQPSHIPERAEQRISALSASTGLTAEIDNRCSARPAFLLSSPEPVTVDVTANSCAAVHDDGAPTNFIWRRLHHRVVKVEGPERIAPEWWRYLSNPHASSQANLGANLGAMRRDCRNRTRDYFRLEDTFGGRFWLFREVGHSEERDTETTESSARWYMHGFFG
jgi:protein ImuB